MANKSVLELAVETGKWDSGIKKAQKALDNFVEASGGLSNALDKDNDKMSTFVKMMGKTESQAKTAKGQMNDYRSTLEQLTRQYNSLNDAQKHTIGKDYLDAIDQIKQKYQQVNQELQEFNRTLNNTGGDTGGGGLFSGGKLDGMLQVFGGNMMTKAVGMLGNLGSELGKCVTDSVALARESEGVVLAFNRLNRPDILDKVREATHGTISDLNIMKEAVKFKDFNLDLDQMGTMLAFAQQKAKDTGQSVDYLVDSIVNGLGRQSLQILDNLGISAAEVRERMKETGDMTQAVGDIIRKQMEEAGAYVETAADRALQAQTEVDNKMLELGNHLKPLSDSFGNMWNEAKAGGLDFLDTVLTPIVNQVTAVYQFLQQIKNLQQSQQNARDAFDAFINSVVDPIMHPAKTGSQTPTVTPGPRVTPKVGGGKPAPVGWLNIQQAKISDLRKQMMEATSMSDISDIQSQIKAEKIFYDMLTGKIGGGVSAFSTPTFGMDAAVKKMEKEMGEAVAKSMEEARKKNGEKETTVKLNEAIGQMAGGMQSVVGGIESLGVEIPKGLKDVIGGIQSVVSILTGISTIITAIQAISAADVLIPFARGGVVRAAGGYTVPGNYGYDAVPSLLTSGELVLNRAQQGNLLAQLGDNRVGYGGNAQPYVDGERIWLGMSNYLNRRGMGEIVTSRRAAM